MNSREIGGYDIIGDIHGEYRALCRLLDKLGYAFKDGAYWHPTRKVIFLGDFIDRGAEAFKVVTLARKMVERGYALAVMGNHEFNAIMAYEGYRKLPTNDVHRPFHDKMIREFPNTYKDMIAWFKTLPVCRMIGNLVAVHACWDPELFGTIHEKGLVDENNVIRPWVYGRYYKDLELRAPLKAMLKGKERKLPKGEFFIDKDGVKRDNVRVSWWNDYKDAPIVACGHYWLKAESPSILSDKVVCVDYSAVKGGFLCAYRCNASDTKVSNENFAWTK